MYGPFGEHPSDYDGYIAPVPRARSIDEDYWEQDRRYHSQAEYNTGGFSAEFWGKPKKTIRKRRRNVPPAA